MDRNAQSVLQQRRSSIGRRGRSTQAVEFFNIPTSPELLETTEALLPEHRERLYPPTVALSMFMLQVLEADGSCQKALAPWLWRGRAVKLVDGTGLSMPDTPENQALYPQPSPARRRPGSAFRWRDWSW